MPWESFRTAIPSTTFGGVILTGGVITADTGGVTANDVVYLSAASKVKPVASLTQRVFGIAMNTAAAGAAVDVMMIGTATLTADGAITAGDAIGPAATTGRAVSLNSITPAGTVAAPTFTGNSVASSAVSGGTPAGTVTAPTITLTNAAPTTNGVGFTTDHLLTTGGGTVSSGISTPTFTGSALGTHTHTTTATGTNSAPAFTGTAQNVGLVVGRAITAAAGSGNTFTAFVFTAGGA